MDPWSPETAIGDQKVCGFSSSISVVPSEPMLRSITAIRRSVRPSRKTGQRVKDLPRESSSISSKPMPNSFSRLLLKNSLEVTYPLVVTPTWGLENQI